MINEESDRGSQPIKNHLSKCHETITPFDHSINMQVFELIYFFFFFNHNVVTFNHFFIFFFFLWLGYADAVYQ